MSGVCAALSSLLSYKSQTRCAFTYMSLFFISGPAAVMQKESAAEPAQTPHSHTLVLAREHRLSSCISWLARNEVTATFNCECLKAAC